MPTPHAVARLENNEFVDVPTDLLWCTMVLRSDDPTQRNFRRSAIQRLPRFHGMTRRELFQWVESGRGCIDGLMWPPVSWLSDMAPGCCGHVAIVAKGYVCLWPSGGGD